MTLLPCGWLDALPLRLWAIEMGLVEYPMEADGFGEQRWEWAQPAVKTKIEGCGFCLFSQVRRGWRAELKAEKGK